MKYLSFCKYIVYDDIDLQINSKILVVNTQI